MKKKKKNTGDTSDKAVPNILRNISYSTVVTSFNVEAVKTNFARALLVEKLCTQVRKIFSSKTCMDYTELIGQQKDCT